jgi:hypothetical protein
MVVNFAARAAALRVLRALETHGASVTWDGTRVVVSPPHREADGVIETLGDLLRSGADGQSLLDQAWACHEPLMRTVKAAKPSDATDAQWRLAIEGLQIFLLSGWADEAERLGWLEIELYAIPPVWARVALCGAGLLIADREVIEVAANTIKIRTATGATQTFYRHPGPRLPRAAETEPMRRRLR